MYDIRLNKEESEYWLKKSYNKIFAATNVKTEVPRVCKTYFPTIIFVFALYLLRSPQWAKQLKGGIKKGQDLKTALQ